MQKITIKKSDDAEPETITCSKAMAKWYTDMGALHRPHGTVPRKTSSDKKTT